MPLNYQELANRYRPKLIRELLVGEAPPPNGTAYFYLPTVLRTTVDIRDNRSLPATIFHHYFSKLPMTTTDYEAMLHALQGKGVFLVDICDEPIQVRNSPDGLRRIKEEVKNLRNSLKSRDIVIDESKITFLLARNNYRSSIKSSFPLATLVPWINFRLPPSRA